MPQAEHPTRRKRAGIDEAAAAFGLTELMPRRNQELSSGQRTLVSIVKAVLHRPDLLILDEPTASLDPDIAARVRQAMLDAHRRDGTALLVTSHNMREVETLCERVVLLSTVSLSVMDETQTRNLLNVLTTSVTPAEYLTGVAAFGLMKLTLTMTTITVMTTLVYGFALNSLGWSAVPIVLLLIVNGWALGFIILGLMLRFGPSAEILTWGLNYVMLSVSGVFFPVSALPGGIGEVMRYLPTGLAFEAMRTILQGKPVPAGMLWSAAAGSVIVLGLALAFCGWMLRIFRRRGFVTRYS
ncbi:AAA family ATPase [Allorhizocola rhizosphaerae]|uniref:AAA family ATPase n=1 Tax=Allorhizocola rhizosphaerae TaxID=1872709 RepID=UPI000E3D7A83|nr:AAA family ATPase [Allorhizocola rhizosphaerae]